MCDEILRAAKYYGQLKAGVILAVHVLELGFVHVRIDLGGGYVRMAEQFLHDAEVGAAGEQMRGEAMPQGVGRQGFLDAGESRVLANDAPDIASIKRSACA